MFKKIKINKELVLKELLKKTPDSIEPGLNLLTDEYPVSGGFIDLLCVDSGDILTIIELKIKEDDSMLMQALGYYDFINQNIDKVAKLYPKFKIDVTESPRIILVAPSFSDTLKKSAKYIDLQIDLFDYDYLSIDHEKGLFCRSVDIEIPQEMPVVMSVDDHLDYITDEKVKTLCKAIIEEIVAIGKDIEVYGTKNYIGFKFNGRLFARIKTKRTFFYTMGTLGSDWEIEKTKIEKKRDFTTSHFNKLKELYQEVGGAIKK